MKIISIFYFPGYADPSATIVIDGKVTAFVEEERLVRNKHATAYFPMRSINYVLEASGLSIQDVDVITVGWDCEAHDSGALAKHFEAINRQYPPTSHDASYQASRISKLGAATHRQRLYRSLRRAFGEAQLPPIEFVDHHLSHAVMAYHCSGFPDSLVLTIDGSGEWATTCWWRGAEGALERLHQVDTPHSLGWFYSAFTEYLGFEAYDGEYKVMGLAAYGKSNPEIEAKLEKMIWYDGAGGFSSDPYKLSMGPRGFSDYYPDTLIEHMGRRPRSVAEEIDEWHIDCAYEVQRRLESIVTDMTRHWVQEAGLANLAIAGGVGLNVKMNGNLFDSGIVDDLFVHPLSSDSGVCIGAAMAHEYERGGLEASRLEDVYYGPEYDDDTIEAALSGCKMKYRREASIEGAVAELLADGKIVGWFQGRMEAGPRALGNRSILADPRVVESRDRVNAVIKYREYWRPFCPSMTPAGAARYLAKHTHAPFMIVTFRADETTASEIPAVVHVDGTARVQIVQQESNPRYFNLIEKFGEATGVPAILNTSFNVKGEPIVCTPHDAIRTFAATGLDALAIGPFLLTK